MFDKLNFKFVMRMTFTLAAIAILMFGICIFDIYFIATWYYLFLAILFPNYFAIEAYTGDDDTSSSTFSEVILPIIIFLLVVLFICLIFSLIINVNRTDKVKDGRIYFYGTGLHNHKSHSDSKGYDLSVIDYMYFRRFLLLTLLCFKTKDKIFPYHPFALRGLKLRYSNRKELEFYSKEEAYKFIKQNHLEPYLRTDLKW